MNSLNCRTREDMIKERKERAKKKAEDRAKETVELEPGSLNVRLRGEKSGPKILV